MVKIKAEIKNKILKFYDLIKKEFPVEKIFIFGSYARGAEKEFSDIDVGVVLNLAAKNEIKISAKLWSLARKIDTSIEPFCIFKNDFDNHPKASVLEDIINSGIDLTPALK
ncbi:MAG TPA: hypothetical protein DC017_02065 [Candidatus Wallbacteria bacterium]|nr:hypothetical protein [Candidatus Wallbacteria bacterium]